VSGLRQVWRLVCDGEPKMGGGYHVIQLASEVGTRAEATAAYNVMRNRGKDNLRVETRFVSDWEES
jgi:hypothetical protein